MAGGAEGEVNDEKGEKEDEERGENGDEKSDERILFKSAKDDGAWRGKEAKEQENSGSD